MYAFFFLSFNFRLFNIFVNLVAKKTFLSIFIHIISFDIAICCGYNGSQNNDNFIMIIHKHTNTHTYGRKKNLCFLF